MTEVTSFHLPQAFAAPFTSMRMKTVDLGTTLPFGYMTPYVDPAPLREILFKSREGISPSPAHRTVRETLASYGSYH